MSQYPHFQAVLGVIAVFFTLLPAAGAQKPGREGLSVSKCWAVQAPGGELSAVAGDSGAVFSASRSGTVSAFDAELGTRLWSTELGGAAVSDLHLANGRIYIATRAADADSAATLRSLSRETGVTIWSEPVEASGKVFLGSDGADVVFITDEISLGRRSAADGELLWARSFPNVSTTAKPLFADGAAIFGTSDKRIHGIDLRTGTEIINFETSFEPVFVSGSIEKGIVWGGERGNLVKMTNDAEDASWRFKAGARMTSAVRVGRDLYAVSHDNFVYNISNYNGDVIWKRRMPARIASFTLLERDIAVVTVIGESAAHLIDLKSGRLADKFVVVAGSGLMPIAPVTFGGPAFYTGVNTTVAKYSIYGCESKNEKAAR